MTLVCTEYIIISVCVESFKLIDSLSNPFLKPTNTKQFVVSSLLKEKTASPCWGLNLLHSCTPSILSRTSKLPGHPATHDVEIYVRNKHNHMPSITCIIFSFLLTHNYYNFKPLSKIYYCYFVPALMRCRKFERL